MDDSIFSYVGVIGGIAGIIGAIISVRSYYLARSFKVLDLRLQAETLRSDTNVALSRLRETYDTALPSRRAILSATGMVNSGAMQKWNEECEIDQQAVESLAGQLGKETAKDYGTLNPAKLASAVAFLHSVKGRVEKIANKYEASLRKDEGGRAELRADRRADSVNPTFPR